MEQEVEGMTDYIKRQDAIDETCQDWCGCDNKDCKHPFNPARDDGPWCDGCDGVESIKSLPPADVAPVVRGEWEITDAYPHIVYCSVCYKRFAQTHWAVWEDGSLPRNFCPNCGADMRGENNDGKDKKSGN